MIEFLTGVLVLITGFYAWATFRILRANERVVQVMNEQSDAMTRPYLTISPFLEPDNPIFYLRIANVGRTAARNLRLHMDKSFHKFGDASKSHDIATFTAFNAPIDAFAPGATIVFSLAQGFVIFAQGADPEKVPQKFVVTAEYEYGLDRRVAEKHIVDLHPYLNSDVPQDALIRKMSELIKVLKQRVVNGQEP